MIQFNSPEIRFQIEEQSWIVSTGYSRDSFSATYSGPKFPGWQLELTDAASKLIQHFVHEKLKEAQAQAEAKLEDQ